MSELTRQEIAEIADEGRQRVRAIRIQDSVHLEVATERNRQVLRWGRDADVHSDFEWLRLITQYAAIGNFVAAAALCEAAEEARRR